MSPPPGSVPDMAASTDRIVGALLGMACGDALGAGYEFTYPSPDAPISMQGGGGFNWEPGEWTDDTQMAICIAGEAATGHLDPAAVGERFLSWIQSDPTDVGIMTRAVLSAASTGKDLPEAARDYCRTHPRCAGNGSLMRTAPVALTRLGDREAIAATAREISDLTHADPLAGDACVLWCLAIDHAIHHAAFDLTGGLESIAVERRTFWEEKIAEAETAEPGSFTPNGFVVTALQAAWAAITQTPVPADRPAGHLGDALVAAVRIGHDTDTVAAIAGSLLGARWGSSAVPLNWKAMLHGWPGYDARDLTRLAVLSAGRGRPNGSGWPSSPSMLGHYAIDDPHEPRAVPLKSDPGVIIGNAAAAPGVDADVIVSLCRMGSEPLRPDGRHIDVLLLDDADPDRNPNLLWILEDTADAVAGWRADGKTVYLHCVKAQNRTPTLGAAYLKRRFGMTSDEALSEVGSVLGNGPANPAFLDALPRLNPA